MNLERPLVSVIIPTYNSAHYLQETLESALAQTWLNKEIIVVNDGSTDNTAVLLEPYKDRIRSIYQENQGLSGARNSGIKSSRGEMLAFLDADDLMEPQFLEKMVQPFLVDPEVDIAFCWWIYVDEKDNRLPEMGKFQFTGPVLDQLVMVNRFPPSTAMVRKEMISKVGLFDVTIHSTQDWDFWLRAAQHDRKFYCVPQELVRYRVHGENMSLNVESMHESQIRVLKKFFANQDLPGRISQLEARAYERIYLTTTQWLLRNGDFEAAKQAFLRCVQIWSEMLCQEETYYSIICAQQPAGYRDTQYFKDLDWATRTLEQLLDAVFHEPGLRAQVAGLKARAEATKSLVLAHHYYLSGQNRQARRLVARAIKEQPALAVDRQTLSLGGRSLLGRKRSQQIKQIASRGSK